jgi:transposase
MSRDELITLVADRDAGIAARDAQITVMAGQLSELMEANEVLAGKLARLEHLLSRNSKNSSSPPSKDDDPGKTPPQVGKRRGGGPRGRGASSPVLQGRIWPGLTPRMSAATGSRRVAASAVMT